MAGIKFNIFSEKDDKKPTDFKSFEKAVKTFEESIKKSHQKNYGTLEGLWTQTYKNVLKKEENAKAELFKKQILNEKMSFKERLNLNMQNLQEINNKIAKNKLTDWNKEQGFFKGSLNILKGLFVDPLLVASKGISGFMGAITKLDNIGKMDFKEKKLKKG